jgi:acylphosphatase
MTVSTTERQRREVYYSGRVQGVGFRFTVRSIARQFAVVGFVRNLPDGRVHLVVEGKSSEIAEFLCDIEKEMQHYIGNVQQVIGLVTNQFSSFEIRH